MSLLSDEIKKRKGEIAARIRELEKALRNAPESRLRLSMNKNNPRFYEMTRGGSSTGKYLTEKEIDRARILAQADYMKKTLEMLRKEQRLVEALTGFYDKNAKCAEEFFSGPEELITARMKPARFDLISPITMDQKMFVENWKADVYDQKGFSPNAPEYYTSSGIRVRSKTEWMIAEMLEKKGVPFYYERPLNLPGIGTIHPDFTVLNAKRRKTYYWEHMGMLDDDVYRESALHRIEQYILNGFYPGRDLLLTHETSTKPIHSKIIGGIIEVYLLS